MASTEVHALDNDEPHWINSNLNTMMTNVLANAHLPSLHEQS